MCQFKVRILGTEYHIIPDVVLFVNGLPVVVVECKSPKVKDAIPEAVDQMLRYSEQRGVTGEGSAPLFYFNQFCGGHLSAAGQIRDDHHAQRKTFLPLGRPPIHARLTTLRMVPAAPTTSSAWLPGCWTKPICLTSSAPSPCLRPTTKAGTIKIVGRYQQFRAVKLAVKRLLTGSNPRERSGIIWHTQGSGKSLTMMFMGT